MTSSGHTVMARSKQANDLVEQYALASFSEGYFLLQLMNGKKIEAAKEETETQVLMGKPMPPLSKNMQSIVNGFIGSRWAQLSMEAQEELEKLLKGAQSEKVRLDAARAVLDRGGWHVSKNDDNLGKEGAVQLDELEKEVERLNKLLQGGDTIDG